MSWSDRRAVLAGLAAALVAPLVGCGFRPLYGEGETGAGTLGRVAVAPPEGRLGFYMRARLDRLLGGPVAASEADYLLEADLRIVKTGLAITEDNATTRYRMNGASTFQLIESKQKNIVLSGEVRTLTAYSATASLYATRAAERDAERRVAEDLAERIALRVAAMEGGGRVEIGGDAAS